jgi:hypothetical protein
VLSSVCRTIELNAPQEESRARPFRVFKDLVKHVDFEDALYYREGEELPQVTIRIGDKLVLIAQGGKLYLLMKDIRWTDYGKTEKPSSLFHPASDPPMQYEDGTTGVGTRMWMRDRVMLTAIHMTFILGFVPTNEIPSRPREKSLPNKGISIILARFVFYHEYKVALLTSSDFPTSSTLGLPPRIMSSMRMLFRMYHRFLPSDPSDWTGHDTILYRLPISICLHAASITPQEPLEVR